MNRVCTFWRCCVLAGAAVLLVAGTAAAQFDRGQISGRVKDAQGGVVPGATVVVTNNQTQIQSTVVSDGTGFYTFPNLSAGKYTVSAELQGFKKALRENMTLDAAGSLTLDFTLETGALSESVTVTAESAPLQTDVALRKTIESKDIEQLSFSGRNPIGVVGLKPGVTGGSFNNYNFSDLGNGGFSINGSRTDENNITVDGATAIRTRSNGAIVGIQNVDALQEVQVLTGDYMPEYGRVSGGQIRMVTKSGGNRFSGSGLLSSRRQPAGQHVDAQPQREPDRPVGRAVQLQAVPATRSAGRSSRTSCSSSARRSGSTSCRCRPTWRPCRPRRCAPATSASCSRPNQFFSGTADHPRPGDRPAVPRQHDPGEPAERQRPGAADRLSAADAGIPVRRQQRDHQQREPAGSAEGQHPRSTTA